MFGTIYTHGSGSVERRRRGGVATGARAGQTAVQGRGIHWSELSAAGVNILPNKGHNGLGKNSGISKGRKIR